LWKCAAGHSFLSAAPSRPQIFRQGVMGCCRADHTLLTCVVRLRELQLMTAMFCRLQHALQLMAARPDTYAEQSHHSLRLHKGPCSDLPASEPPPTAQNACVAWASACVFACGALQTSLWTWPLSHSHGSEHVVMMEVCVRTQHHTACAYSYKMLVTINGSATTCSSSACDCAVSS
jgi:hypothetical protein